MILEDHGHRTLGIRVPHISKVPRTGMWLARSMGCWWAERSRAWVPGRIKAAALGYTPREAFDKLKEVLAR